ncbi:MAG TPA: ATP-dependent Clp protease proteolytic subunit, partial [bacterium]|nr:ATP-dependent Clp protease proteolytic subunit [bacterium]HMW32736.1 ATP-dependent Clp protease proteolytic subunit [bacterium]HMY34548.1 ATP-dependent Clp protease proteolytic subunit [bacterium]HMZ03323.1 ATP-dependent Clp protease proteolytic subunit [bacterium]HNB09883.1 ATP-dependent Clp protease proteolytic subunit [bacterium]
MHSMTMYDLIERLDEEEEEKETEEPQKEDPLGKKMAEFFLQSRTILLFEQISPKVTRRVITQLLFLNEQDSKKEIKIFINSPGGVADDGLAIYDLIKLIDAPVKTIVCGLAASAAAIILVAAKKENRLALPHSRIMIHQPLGGVRGSTKDIEISTQQIVRLKQELNEILARETGQPVEKVAQDTNRDYWFTADEAKAYGMISKTVTGLSKI